MIMSSPEEQQFWREFGTADKKKSTFTFSTTPMKVLLQQSAIPEYMKEDSNSNSNNNNQPTPVTTPSLPSQSATSSVASLVDNIGHLNVGKYFYLTVTINN